MKTSVTFTLLTILVVQCTSSDPTEEKKSNVIVLNSQNFEHLTQVATGATTGDWLIEFYAPWCGHCKKLAPIYEEVATALKGEVNVAKVDVTQNQELGQRFSIRGFPTIKFFSKGKIYDYENERIKSAFINFAMGGFKKVKSSPVPKVPSPMDDIFKHLHIVQQDFKSLLDTKKNVLLVTFGIGLLVGAVFAGCCCCICRRSSHKKSKKE